MSLINKTDHNQLTSERRLPRTWRDLFRRQRERHDPMLVLSIEDFNFVDGWARTFNPFKARDNGF